MPNPSRISAIAAGQAYATDGAFEAELAARVAHPTASQDLPASLPALTRYLTDEIAPAFAPMGFTTRIYPNPVTGQGPILLASRMEDPALVTVLGYGHGDVIRGQDAL